MGESAGDKTEEPTPHRLREAREKGQIAKSKEVTTAFLILVTFGALRLIGENMWNELLQMVRSIMGQIPYAKDFSLGFAGYIMLTAARGLVFVVGPLFGIVFIAALIAEALQTGFVVAGDPLAPKIERINPLEGFKRIFSMQGLVELVKSLIKIFLVFYIAWSAAKDELPYLLILMDGQPWDALALGGTIVYKISMRVGIIYIGIALLDYLYKRWEYMKNLKMTRQEVKEEYKRLEGDPLIKQRMRDAQRQAAYNRMMTSVPQADVVVTNPTHIAVALKYDASKMKAPLLLAKGERIIAEEIKSIAEEHEIPIVENEPLARSIHRTTKIGQDIPPQLYQAVAEILAYIYKNKRERAERRKKIANTPLKPEAV